MRRRGWRAAAQARTFCGVCGSPLTFQTDTMAEELDVVLAALDEAADWRPEAHIWTASAAKWAGKFDNHLPRYEKQT